ncbi:MAG: efflux RND transporter periplasmic adaptor subunit [Planctomycetaceae bacterium]|nr:efflux RND transporter periplasmic adaptor subunit [Planctomycetaceae bacterium]
MFHRLRGEGLCWCGMLLGLLIIQATQAFGHEGHQPLPTKGVQVDLKKGHITLSKAARDVLDVRTVAAERRESTERLRAYATIVAPWTKYAVVTSRLPGRVVALHVRPGDAVAAGQLLAEVDSLDLHTLRLDYQQAQNDIDLSEKILAGVEPAAKAGSIPGQKLIEAQQTHRQNLNTLQVLQAKAAALNVEEAMLATDEESRPLRLPIRSTVGGVVVHADLAVGKFIEPTEHLMDIVDLSTVWVKIGVLEQDWHRVAAGQTVRLTVSGLPGRVFETKVDRLGLLLDPQTHQSIAWAELPNSDKSPALRPGMNGQAELSWRDKKPVLAVPSQAVLSDGAERYVLVEEAATKNGSEYQKVAVVVGRQSAGHTEILAGKLLPDDRVVTRGGHELSSIFFLGVLRIGTETARTIGLKVEPVTERVVDRILSFDGALDVSPQRRTTASSQLGGKLVNIRVDRGQSVKAGEVLAEIASLELQDIQLQLLRSHLDGELWNGTLTRLRNVSDSVPRRLVLETEGQVRTIQTKSANLRQKLLTLGLTAAQIDGVLKTKRVVDTLPVPAPIDGAVVDFDRMLGQVVRADESLFEIHDMSQVRVQAFVGERDSARVQVGQTARIRLVAHPDLETEGTVTRIGPVVGADSRTQAAWIEFQKPLSVSLQHNMSARVTLTTDRPSPTLAVPLNAVVRDGLRSFVFVQKADGTFDRRRVELGRADDRFVEIKSGLTRGEMIAISGVPQIQTAYAAVR